MKSLERDLVFDLLGRGLLDYPSLVDGRVTVVGDRTRNSTFAVFQREGPDYFAKQSAGHPNAAVTLRCEAECYRLAQEQPEFESLGELLPRLLFYDPERQLLVLDLIPEAENAAAYHRRIGRCPQAVGVLLGSALATCHNLETERHRAALTEEAFPREKPWILSFDLDGEHSAYGLSPANEQLLRRVRAEPAMVAALLELRCEWRCDALVHGDLKWENCVVYPRQAPEDELQLKIVDWESVALGDPRWDIAGLLVSYLSALVLAPLSGKDPLDLEEVRRQLPLIRPAIRSFWEAYGAVRHRPLETGGELDLMIEFTVARLLLTIFELQVFAQQTLLQAGILYTLALDLLRDPEGARHALFAA